MIDINSPDLSFKTESEVEAYARFFLSIEPSDVEEQNLSQEKINEFNTIRERQLKAQLDEFRQVDLPKANIGKVAGEYYKLCKVIHKKPLSSAGSSLASSRFNYKNQAMFRNKAIYLGKNKLACEIELFHLEEQRRVIKKTYDRNYNPEKEEIKFAKYNLYSYEVDIDNILILTSESCRKAINISQSAINNEWYDINDRFSIPSASQILGLIARTHGCNGILYSSVRHQIKNNLVLFEENTGKLEFTIKKEIDYDPSAEILEIDETIEQISKVSEHS